MQLSKLKEKIFNSTTVNQTTDYSMFFILPIVSYLLLTFYRHTQSDLYMSMLDNMDFYIHEIWHVVFMLSGNEFVTILWGTLLQLIIPLVCLVWFYIQRDSFAVALCYAWIWTNIFYISTYSGDAENLSLPLFSMWGWWDIIHDWNYIFTHLWVLEHTDFISNSFKVIAIWFFIVFFVNTLFLIINKFRKI